MKKGTQIAYVPQHAEGDVNHPDVEFGFVMREVPTAAHFCRYWRKGHLGELRTRANSELTPNEFLVEYTSVSGWIVDQTIAMIERDQ